MDINKKLAYLKENNLYRSLREFGSPQEAQTIIDGKKVLLFSSNSYLGISNNPAIKQKATMALEKHGTGSGGSRLTTGNHELYTQLEHLLAEFKGSEASLAFNTGYMANIGAISALCESDETIFSDELNHASIIDGCRLSKATVVKYAHADVDDLRAKINEVSPKGGMIVTDSVFSMDGDIAPLPNLAQIAKDHNLLLMADDAHATGVIGETGRGSLEHFGLSCDDIDIVMGTLSKSVASEGSFICGKDALCDYLKNTARSFIFSTALAPATVAAAIGGIEYILAHPEAVQKLRENIRYFTGKLGECGITAAGETAIIPIVIGGENEAREASARLFDMNIFIPCIRYPTVKKGAARLRVTLMATHTRVDMDYVVDCLKNFVKTK